MYLKFTVIKLNNFANPKLIFMVTFAAAAVAVVLVVLVVVVVVIVVVNKSAQAIMLTHNQEMRSSNYGHDTNHFDQYFMFFISP